MHIGVPQHAQVLVLLNVRLPTLEDGHTAALLRRERLDARRHEPIGLEVLARLERVRGVVVGGLGHDVAHRGVVVGGLDVGGGRRAVGVLLALGGGAGVDGGRHCGEAGSGKGRRPGETRDGRGAGTEEAAAAGGEGRRMVGQMAGRLGEEHQTRLEGEGGSGFSDRKGGTVVNSNGEDGAKAAGWPSGS